ncbi:type II toxin-antitoxin system HipA family toxin [Thorsellia kenyensis]|uniref:Type II toxin-antitoxin system HipA family toxin n=1 Tax=Thorsellia kenyensis TaxID=1549888 RepID=A0ABV6CB89_9GAMM
MIISNRMCYVWKWISTQPTPVICGRLNIDELGNQVFTYGASYLRRKDAESIYIDELPLKQGIQYPKNGMSIFSCLRDAAPDAWGRRVINSQLMGRDYNGYLDEITYLLNSASDRIGALDFQESSTNYKSREADGSTLDELLRAADIISAGEKITPDLDNALMHGTSLGGARPKAMINDGNKKYIAKFSASNDSYDIVKSEYIAMQLASIAGISVANTRYAKSLGKDVLLVERFDRSYKNTSWYRRPIVSGLTVLNLDENWAREASYITLVRQIKKNGVNFLADSIELFKRMVFNVLIGNTDDHARNHAFFIENDKITLTPAYDICPQNRMGGEASHGMKLDENSNLSLLALCLSTCEDFNITKTQGEEIIIDLIRVIIQNFDKVCNEINASYLTRKLLFRRVILNPYIFNQCEWIGAKFNLLDNNL